MSISTHLQRARKWRDAAKEPGIPESDRVEANWNAASFECDFFAEILQTVNPSAYRVAMELLYPGSEVRIDEIFEGLKNEG
jgi:hypothetical protein